jgi:CBS domain-containing protein
MVNDMRRAKDLMTKDAICIKKTTPVFEAMELMRKNDIAGVPVVEDDMTLVGILTEKDVLKFFYDCERIEDSSTKDYMTREVIHFDENDYLPDICDCLITNNFRRIPVTSNGKVVGIISRPDVIQYVLQAKHVPQKA